MGLVAFKKLYTPKINPTNAPTIGPSNIPPKIAGICIIVALPAGVGTGINPNPVTPKMIAIAPSIPEIASCRVVSLNSDKVDLYSFFHLRSSSVSLDTRRNTDKLFIWWSCSFARYKSSDKGLSFTPIF